MALHAHFDPVDLVVFILTLVTSMGIGIYFSRVEKRKQSNNEYLMAGRSMSSFPVAISVLASFVSSIAILGTPAEIYSFGAQFWLTPLSNFITIPVMAVVFLPIYYNLGLTSSYEYLEKRFSRCTRMLASILFVVQTLVYQAIVLYGPSLALESATGLPLWISILATGVVCTCYTTVGGMKAVIWTDVFQGVVMLGGLLLIIIFGSVKVGGISRVFEISTKGERLKVVFSSNPTVRQTFWSMIIGWIFNMLPIYATNQTAVQRFLTTKSFGAAKRAVWLNLPLTIFSTTVTVLTGLVLYAYYADCDPKLHGDISKDDEILPLFVVDVLGRFHGVPGVFVACLFCGTLSTVASGLNSLAAVTVEDYLPYCIQSLPQERETLVSKVLVCLYGLISIILAFIISQVGNMILQMSASMFGCIGGPMLGLFSLGILTRSANSKGVIVGVISGMAVVSWITIGSIVHPPVLLKLPVAVTGCPAMNSTNSTFPPITLSRTLSNNSFQAIYSVSFFWYGLIGFAITYVVGYFGSFAFKQPSVPEDPRLFFDYSSLFHPCMGNHYEEIETRRQPYREISEEPEDTQIIQ